MGNLLVLAGNVFEPTFLGACYAAQEAVGNVDSIYIFDTKQSAEKGEEQMRTQKVRELIGDVEVASVLVNDNTLQTVIPNKLAELIRSRGLKNIIVDLSNGQKITVSILYAVSTISRIPHIYVLDFISRPSPETRIWDQERFKDWDYLLVNPLQEIMNITQSSFVELIYYRDRIEQITDGINTVDESLARDVQYRLEHSLLDYFAAVATEDVDVERIERCVNGLGKICEDVTGTWYAYCERNGLVQGGAHKFNAQIQQIMKYWNQCRAKAAEGKLDITETTTAEAVLPTLVSDTMLETMRIYRNMASHSKNHYQYRREDARLAMDMTLLILERLAGSKILAAPIQP
ncbi:MAG: hypothetical protein KDE20_00470 [Caldilineaceae bacterium]|nr:hypothetical protein [Caldilineaceae bacterium]MCB9140465.1 hypothetical protein [Caldilineaceae bacterium]